MFDAEKEIKLRLETLITGETFLLGLAKDNSYIPDKCVFINQYNDRVLRQFSNRKQYESNYVQILVRGEQQNQASAKTLAYLIYEVLQSTSWTTNYNIIIDDVSSLQKPVFTSIDSQGRYLYTINFEVKAYIEV